MFPRFSDVLAWDDILADCLLSVSSPPANRLGADDALAKRMLAGHPAVLVKTCATADNSYAWRINLKPWRLRWRLLARTATSRSRF
jgi:hypothetical protein